MARVCRAGPVAPEGGVCGIPWLSGLLSALLQPGPSHRASSGLRAQPQVCCLESLVVPEPEQPLARPGPAFLKPQGGARTMLRTTGWGIIMDQSVKNQPGCLFHQLFKTKQNGYTQWFVRVLVHSGPGERKKYKRPCVPLRSPEGRRARGPEGRFPVTSPPPQIRLARGSGKGRELLVPCHGLPVPPPQTVQASALWPGPPRSGGRQGKGKVTWREGPTVTSSRSQRWSASSVYAQKRP